MTRRLPAAAFAILLGTSLACAAGDNLGPAQPRIVLGFSQAALMVYVFIVAAQATFIHANVRWEFKPLRRLVATPAFHHWHHSAEREAIDRNFAVHTPVWDLLFGTYYLPAHWPARYGLSGRHDVPVPEDVDAEVDSF